MATTVDELVFQARYEQALSILLRAIPEWPGYEKLPEIELTAETTFSQAGMNSLDIVELVMLLEDDMGIEISDEIDGNPKTLGELAIIAAIR